MTRAAGVDELSLLDAARTGNRRALAELVAAYLPLVYSIVRRGLGGIPDVDDVVQETMLRVLRELRALRAPESFRPWLMTITTRQVSTHLRRWQAQAERTTALDEVADALDTDTEDLVLLRLELSGQRRQVARACRWLDPDDVALLSLWWLESAGQLTRTELASALKKSVAHAGVRVQRVRDRLESARSIVAALDAGPRCAELATALTGWDGKPGPLWRKRILRHVRACSVCDRASTPRVPIERLVGCVMLLSATVPPTSSTFGELVAEICYAAGRRTSRPRCGPYATEDVRHMDILLLNTPKQSGNVRGIDG